MRALVFKEPWELAVEEVDDPSPGPGDVVLRVVATGICGSDVHGFSGESGRRRPGQVMGHETVGVVEEVGSEVDPALGVRPGTVATVNPLMACGDCPGCRAGAPQSCPNRRVIGVTPQIVSAFAERLACPADNVVSLPAEMPVHYGALVEPLAVGLHAARRGGCSADETVLVVGGGPIGQACVLAARRQGAERVMVSEPNPRRRELAGSLGAVPVDPQSCDLRSELQRAFGGPATLVLDAVGSTASMQVAIDCTAFGTRIVLLGMNTPRLELPAYAISTEERTVLGSFCYTPAEFDDTARWVGTAPEVLAGLVDGHVDLPGAPAAFDELARGASSASKILVHPHGVETGGSAR
jgi:threonine dehydrogenase-like Zn-dependent dehydrogenase